VAAKIELSGCVKHINKIFPCVKDPENTDIFILWGINNKLKQ